MNAIAVMWIRQVKRYVRSKSRIIGSLGMPILFLVALGFGFGPIFAKAGGGNYIQFLAPGIMGMSILFMSVFNGLELIWDRQFGFLKESLVAPVSRNAIVLGRTLGGATVSTLQGIIVLIVSLLIGFQVSNWLFIPLAIFFMFLISFLFNALGTIIAAKLEDTQAFQLIVNFVIMPIFFLSGALFPIGELPSGLGFVTKLNPLSYGVDALRYSLTGFSELGIVLDFVVLIVGIVILSLIGGYLFSNLEA